MVGTLGWLAGGVAAGMVHDLATASICLVVAAGFGGLGLFLARAVPR